MIASATAASVALSACTPATQVPAATVVSASPRMPFPSVKESFMKITKVRSILTAPDGIALVIVKVETDQPGLYGVGCATFTQRPTLVAKAVEEYLAPLLQGRHPANIRRDKPA
jgi:hypothetical protein